jgi:hypothetical protein
MYALIHLSQNLQVKMTFVHIPITLQYKPINCSNQISLIYEPPITLCLFLVIFLRVLLASGPFGPQKFVKTPHILIIKPHSCEGRIILSL